VVQAAREALERCGRGGGERLVWLLEGLIGSGSFDEALPVAEQLIDEPPADARSHGRVALLAGEAVLQSGDGARAEQLFLEAVRRGASSCRLQRLLAEAAHLRGEPLVGADRAVEAFRCGGERDAALLLAGASWAADAGDRSRVGSLLRRLETMRLSADQAERRGRLARWLDGTDGGAP
jgi:predicted Zn-dependent protease